MEFIQNYDVPFLKIPSAHIVNKELLTEAAVENDTNLNFKVAGILKNDVIDSGVPLLL